MLTTLFAFTHRKHANISAEIVSSVAADSCYLLDCTSRDSFNASFQKLEHELAKHDELRVIGLGQYSGRDRDRLRLESTARNRFRNSKIVKGGPDTYPLALDAQMQNIKIADGIGNSWCNLACYLLSRAISQKGQNANLYFFHIPKDYPTEQAVAELRLWV